VFSYQLKTSHGQPEDAQAAFTYADYKALYPEKLQELMVIPPKYESDFLVGIDEYLSLEGNKIYGKVPFIWVVDENSQLLKAVVPNLWVTSTQERLDYWQFLQRISGVDKSTGKVATPDLDHERDTVIQATEKISSPQIAQNEWDEGKIHLALERMVRGLLNEKP
jgi:hypothetical protein